jgi:arginine exporter protein ArgO
MNEKTKLGIGILEAALLLGLLGDALLRVTPWGINVALWVGVLIAALTTLRKQRPASHAGHDAGRWLLACAFLFAAAFAWRDSQTLRVLDVLLILVLLSLAALEVRGRRVALASLTDYALAWTISGLNAFFGTFPLIFRDVNWREMPRGKWSKHVLAVVRGLAIALPLLLIFGALLAAADAVFERLIGRAFVFDPEDILMHAFIVLFCTWITAGYLRGALLSRGVAHDREAMLTSLGLDAGFSAAQKSAPVENGVGATRADAEEAQTPWLSLGIVELGIVLGLLNALFMSFVVVQLRYLFGGAQLVVNSAGLTYAEYARRGFFELVWVAGLVLPLLLASHWLLRKERRAHVQIFRALAATTVLLLFVIMASAVVRMRLYQSEYGLTELRFYTMAFMGWLGLVFAWFAWTVLVRRRRERFAVGALVAALCVAGALHFLNPDALITKTNLARAQQQERFDEHYAVSLGADAFPALAAALDSMSVGERRVVASAMLAWLKEQEGTDWRSWNWSRWRARRAIAPRTEQLNEWIKQSDAPAQANEFQRVQTALAQVAGTSFAVAVERQNTHPFRPEFRRHLVLLSNNQPVAKLEMSYDVGGLGNATLLRLSAAQLAVQDATDVYLIDLKLRTLTKRDTRLTDPRRAQHLGTFAADKTGAWRFAPSADNATP